MTTDLSPEYIEAQPKDQVVDVRQLAQEIHAGTFGILETPLPSAEIERQLRLRTAIKLKMDETIGFLRDQAADIEAVIRDMRTQKGYITSDIERLESYFFNTLRQEKNNQA